MSTSTSRRLIAAMQVTLDGRILGPEGEVDWVDSWADGLELLPPVDGFVLGGSMFPDYEQFWSAILDDPRAASAMLGRDPCVPDASHGQDRVTTAVRRNGVSGAPGLVAGWLTHAGEQTAYVVARPRDPIDEDGSRQQPHALAGAAVS